MLTTLILLAVGVALYVYSGKLIGGAFLIVVAGWAILNARTVFRRAKVMAILSQKFHFDFPATSALAHLVNRIERASRGQGYNEYELAAIYMAEVCAQPEQYGIEGNLILRANAKQSAEKLAVAGLIRPDVFAKVSSDIWGRTTITPNE
jgi:hypothetical protein